MISKPHQTSGLLQLVPEITFQALLSDRQIIFRSQILFLSHDMSYFYLKYLTISMCFKINKHTHFQGVGQPRRFPNTACGAALKKPAVLKTCLRRGLGPGARIQLWFLRFRITTLLVLPDSGLLSLLF